MCTRSQPLRHNRLVDLLEDDDYEPEGGDIYILPPDTGDITDEDSGDEDGGGNIDNVPGSILRQPTVSKKEIEELLGEDFK